jgi:hypothetical protein
LQPFRRCPQLFLPHVAVNSAGLRNSASPSVENQLNCTLPDGYIEFLSITNGLKWNGLQIFASETMPIVGCADVKILGFVDLNLIYRENEDCLDLLFFGESGIDSYVYCISAKQYQILDRVSLSLTETFDSFEMLIYEAFQCHL